MRDPARINRILDRVHEVWTRYPDLRLGQLIVNAIRPSQPCPQVFSAEDDVTERGLALAADRPKYTANEVDLPLTKNEAVVLFELVARTVADGRKLTTTDPAEEAVFRRLFDLLAAQMPEPRHDRLWPFVLEQARDAVRPPK